MTLALLVSLMLTQSPTAGAAGVAGEGADPVLKGFDVSLTVFNSSGVFFGEGGYTNSLTFWVEPSWAFGQRFFKDTWFKHLSLNLRFPIEVQLAGNTADFGGTHYATPAPRDEGPAVYNPETVAITRQGAPAPGANPVILRDMFIQLAHSHLFTIPGLGIDVMSSLRAGLPTSTGSRNAGLITSLGLAFILERKFFDRFSLGYMVRPTKFFFSSTHGPIRHNPEPVYVNGNPEPTYKPASTGVANADFMILNGVWAALELPKGFGVSVNYFTFNTKPFENNGGCNPIGVAGVDTCAAGAALGSIQNQWRNEHWFLASVDYHHSFWSLSLGLSTFRTILTTDRKVSQPFFESNRNNATSIYLSFTASAEGLAGFATAAGGTSQ